MGDDTGHVLWFGVGDVVGRVSSILNRSLKVDGIKTGAKTEVWFVSFTLCDDPTDHSSPFCRMKVNREAVVVEGVHFLEVHVTRTSEGEKVVSRKGEGTQTRRRFEFSTVDGTNKTVWTQLSETRVDPYRWSKTALEEKSTESWDSEGTSYDSIRGTRLSCNFLSGSVVVRS